MKRACLLLLPAMLLIVLAASGCNDESKPKFTRVRVTPECGVAPLEVEAFAAVSGGNESGDPLGGTNNLELVWSFGDGGTGRTAVDYHTFDIPGDYIVTVTAKDPDGNTATTSVPVSVQADSLVVSAATNFPDGNVPVGEIVQFELMATACDIDYPAVPGDAVKMIYYWEMGDAGDTIYTGVAPAFTYGTAGTYDVRVRVTYPEQAVTRWATLTLNVGP